MEETTIPKLFISNNILLNDFKNKINLLEIALLKQTIDDINTVQWDYFSYIPEEERKELLAQLNYYLEQLHTDNLTLQAMCHHIKSIAQSYKEERGNEISEW